MPLNFTCWKVKVVNFHYLLFAVGQSLSHVWLFSTPWTAARQAALSFTIFQSLLKLMSIESMMSSNHLILYSPLLRPSIFPSISVFSSESALCISWSKHWSFRFSNSPSSDYLGLIHEAVQGAFRSILGRLGDGVRLPKLWPSCTVTLPAHSRWLRLGPYSQTRLPLAAQISPSACPTSSLPPGLNIWLGNVLCRMILQAVSLSRTDLLLLPTPNDRHLPKLHQGMCSQMTSSFFSFQGMWAPSWHFLETQDMHCSCSETRLFLTVPVLSTTP